MLVKDIKPIGKFGKKFSDQDDIDVVIGKIIERPLQKVCKECSIKNIETLMSSANKNNISKKNKKPIKKADVLIEIAKSKKMINLGEIGKGYAWLLINYNTLSDENRKILFSMEEELGEDTIWFIKSTYIQNLNKIITKFKFKEIKEEEFNDKYSKEFFKRQIPLMYNIRYPLRTVGIRMAIDEQTTVEEVEKYYDKIINKLVKQ